MVLLSSWRYLYPYITNFSALEIVNLPFDKSKQKKWIRLHTVFHSLAKTIAILLLILELELEWNAIILFKEMFEGTYVTTKPWDTSPPNSAICINISSRNMSIPSIITVSYILQSAPFPIKLNFPEYETNVASQQRHEETIWGELNFSFLQ